MKPIIAQRGHPVHS